MTRSGSSYALAFGLFLLGGLLWEGYQIVLWRLVRFRHSGFGLAVSGIVGFASFVTWLVIEPGYDWLGLVGVGLLVNVMFGFVLYSYRRRGAVSRPSSHVVWPTDLGGLTRVLVGILGLMFVAGGIWQFATASSGSEYLMGAAVAMFGVVGAVAAFRGKSPSWLAEESITTVNEPTRSRSNHHRN